MSFYYLNFHLVHTINSNTSEPTNSNFSQNQWFTKFFLVFEMKKHIKIVLSSKVFKTSYDCNTSPWNYTFIKFYSYISTYAVWFDQIHISNTYYACSKGLFFSWNFINSLKIHQKISCDSILLVFPLKLFQQFEVIFFP